MVLKKLLYIFCISFYFFTTTKDTVLNDHEPIHVFAALKFPLSSVKDTFTLNIFEKIDATFGKKGIGLDTYQIEHIKKTYLYLIFLTKLEKVKTDSKYAAAQKDFAPFLKDNRTQQPHMLTTELLQSQGWSQVTIDEKDIQNSTMWQFFCKSMVTDIYAYLKLALNILHNTEKQEFNYIPHFETSYYDQDFEQLRNINAIIRIKIELEQQIQYHYLSMCNDWKNLPVMPVNSKNKNKVTTCYQATQTFSLTEFYQKTHDVHSLMGTRTKVNNNESLNHQDFLSATQMVSPLKDYVFCYLLLYELYGQLTSFMTLENLDQVLSICSTSNLIPNIFPYTQDQYIPISELLATKSAAQSNNGDSIHPPIKTYKKEDLSSYAGMLNPTRKPTQDYIKNKVSTTSSSNESIEQQGFLDFFKNIGSDIVHAGEAAWSDIKQGAESAWDCTKNFGESIGLGIGGIALEVVGQGSKGNELLNESQEDLTKSITDLSSAVKGFGDALKDGIVAPVAELTGDLVSFITDDKKVGEDYEAIIDNSASVIVNLVSDAVTTIATEAVYFISLPKNLALDVVQLTVAAVYAASGHTDEAAEICHTILRSLVNVYLATAKVAKNDFADIMQALSIVTNAITTLFNDLIVEVVAMFATGGASLFYNMIMAASGNDQDNILSKANNLVRNTLNQHRQVENQILGVAVCVAVDVVTGGEGAAADELILDSATSDAFDETINSAKQGVEDAQKELENTQQKLNEAQKEANENPDDQAAQEKLKEQQEKLKQQEDKVAKEKEKLQQAKDTKTKAIKDAKDSKYGKNLIEKMQNKGRNFFSKIKNFSEKSSDLLNSAKTGIQNLAKTLASKISTSSVDIAESSSQALESSVSESENIAKESESIAQDSEETLPSKASQKLKSAINNYSQKVGTLTKNQQQFNDALTEFKAAQDDPEKFVDAQKKLIDASTNVQKSITNTQDAQVAMQRSFKQAAQYQTEFEKNSLQYISKNIDEQASQAEQDLKTAQENLSTEKEIGNQDSINQAEQGVKNAQQKLKNIQDAQNQITEQAEQAANLAAKDDMSLSEKFSSKVKDVQNYIKSQRQSFVDLFTKSNTEAEANALETLNKEQATLKTAQAQLAEDQKAFDEAKAAAKANPNDPDTQADFDRAQRKLESSQKEVRSAQKDVDNAQEYYDQRKDITKESKWDTTKRYLGKIGDAISPIGMVMNVVFNITPVISSYNQDQKNILQQKQQTEQMEELWKANNETKVSTIYNCLEYLEEFYEKQKNSIVNQVLGLSLLQNYNYESISQFEQSILQSLAMIYTLQLYPDPKTNLVTGNIGTLWGINSSYLNLYPSQGFYTTTVGRSDFPFAQEIAQAPELLNPNSSSSSGSNSGSKVKIKEWFNQRCTGIDKKNENQSLKKSIDPLNVSIAFKFLYTLESEFYVGIYMGKNLYDYFNTSYIASLLGTNIQNLTSSYNTFIQNPVAYQFKLNFIDLNESYMAKMVVLYRKSGTDSLKLGVYEHNLTTQEWLFTQELPATAQLSVDHVYNLEATLNNNTLEVSLIVDQETQSKISQTVTVTPLDNQRQYGIISSSAAIEWNQISPKVSLNKSFNVRKSNKNLTPEIERSKKNKLAIQYAVNQTFGGKKITLISQQKALIFGQYIYASVQTDISKITPKNPADLLIFATNTNGKITNLGKMPNSFVDNATNVVVSLITGHVFDSKWNCIQTIPQPWNIYSAPSANYGPFNPSINKVITDQQQALGKKLSKIKFGSFNLDIADNALMLNGQYVYTCTQTLQDSSGKSLTDYLVFAQKIEANPTKITLGLPPTSPNSDCILSLVSGNIYTKATVIPNSGVPTSSQTAVNIYNIDIINYIEQLTTTSIYNGNATSFTQIIQNQQQVYSSQTPPLINPTPPPVISVAPKQDITTEAKTIPFKFHFGSQNFGNRQKQAASSFKFHFSFKPKP